MRSVSTVPDTHDLRLLRPLLTVSRDSIEAYCQHNELRYVEDESNRDVSMFRNHLRHKLLPILMEDNPHIIASLSNLATTIDADEDLLDHILEDTWSSVVTDVSVTRIAMDLNGWRMLALSMRRRLLRSGFSQLRPGNIELSFETTELARRVAETGNTGDQVMLPGDVLLEVEYEQLILQTSDHLALANDWPQLNAGTSHKLPVPGELRLDGGWIISASRLRDVDFDLISNNADSWSANIRAAFADELIVRTQTAGERLRPLGMGGKSAKILDIMSNRKIPKHWRERWPILAGRDHPLWLVGHSMDERATITSDDQEMLLVRLRRISSVDEH
jgi:tRNA(Ile)-lysidine synthase